MEQAATVIRRHVQSEEVTVSLSESAVRFRTAKSEEALARVLADLVSADLGVSQFREVQTDLEEAFMTAATGDAEEVGCCRCESCNGGGRS